MQPFPRSAFERVVLEGGIGYTPTSFLVARPCPIFEYSRCE